jgi:hypothetical protein
MSPAPFDGVVHPTKGSTLRTLKMLPRALRFPERKCSAGFYCIHRRSQELCGVAASRISTCASPSAPANRSAQRSEVGAAFGRPRHWQSPARLIGTYHGVSRDQLQVYLDEFVFRHKSAQATHGRYFINSFVFKTRNVVRKTKQRAVVEHKVR